MNMSSHSILYTRLIYLCNCCFRASTDNSKSQPAQLNSKPLHLFRKRLTIHTLYCPHSQVVPRPDGKSQAACKGRLLIALLYMRVALYERRTAPPQRVTIHSYLTPCCNIYRRCSIYAATAAVHRLRFQVSAFILQTQPTPSLRYTLSHDMYTFV